MAPPSWEEGRGEDPLVRAANEVAADQDPITLERAGVHNDVITGGGGGGGRGGKNNYRVLRVSMWYHPLTTLTPSPPHPLTTITTLTCPPDSSPPAALAGPL